MNQVAMTTKMVMDPPKMTDGITPMILAASPLSNCPSSLLLLMNIEFTLITLPRILSGVFICTMVPRIITLMPSSMPLIKSAKKESQNNLDKPNTN